MRATKVAAVLVVLVLTMSVLATAGRNKFGVSDTQKVTFNDPIRVGDVVLPKGEYKIQHVMEGENHMMVFTQVTNRASATARVKCQLVSLQTKAAQNLVLYGHDQSDVHVLQELIFRGDSAKHVF
jgi:hypothetical protein